MSSGQDAWPGGLGADAPPARSSGGVSRAQLHKGLRLAYPASSAQAAVVHHLLGSRGYTASLRRAAAAAGADARELQQLLAADPSFNLQQGGDEGETNVTLSVTEFLRRVKGATECGTLLRELPPPAGLVNGLPQRPGQPVCRHFLLTGSCGFGSQCVFDHPPALLARRAQPPGAPAAAAAAPHMPVAPAPPPGFGQPPAAAAAAASVALHPQRPGRPVCRSFQQDGFCAYKKRCIFDHPPELLKLGVQQAAGLARSSGGASSSGGGGAVIGSPAAAPAAWPALPTQQPGGDSGAPPPRRPGAPPCLLFLARGVCPSGAACRFDHPPAGPADAGAAAAAGPLHAAPAAASTAAATLEPPLLTPPQTTLPPQLQQRRQQRQEPGSSSSSSSSKLNRKQPLPVTGCTAEGLPQRPGASSCPYFMYTGSCKYRAGCVYHHPADPALPAKFAEEGKMSAPWPVGRPAPLVLLLHHVSRLWDYDASPTAQLKTWLAKLLLMQGNPGAQVWTASAAAPAARDPGGLGPYSMPLAQAGGLLRDLWAQQPGVQEAGEFPAAALRQLLLGSDVYLKVLPADPQNESHVQLDVAAIRRSLNW